VAELLEGFEIQICFSAFVVPFLFTKNKCFRVLLVEFVVIVLSSACRLVRPRKVFQQNMPEKQPDKAYHWWYRDQGPDIHST